MQSYGVAVDKWLPSATRRAVDSHLGKPNRLNDFNASIWLVMLYVVPSFVRLSRTVPKL